MTATLTAQRSRSATSANGTALPSLALTPVFVIAAAFVALELAVSARYGLHRDELYFLACGRHLAWGYVDQPPLVPTVARVASTLFGPSAVSLRLLPTFTGGTTVVLAALIARELGGARRAQTFAALGTMLSPVLLGTSHLLSTAAFDVFLWTLLAWLFLRMLRTGDDRWWVAIGVTAGVALLNKWNVLFLLGALVIGVAATPGHRRRLTSPWAIGSGVLALAIWSPNLVWNAQHDWAEIAMLHSLHAENSTLGASIGFIPTQLVIVGPALAFLWIGGWRWLRGHHDGRVFAVAFAVLLAAYVLTGAKPYYISGAYPALFGAGGAWYAQRLATRFPADDGARRARWIAAVLIAATIVSLPIVLPVLPASSLPSGSWEGGINKDLSATVGWPEAVRQIATVADALPPAERSHVVIFTGDYGAAGAVDRYGARYALPHAISGHNTYWWWGWGNARDGATTIAVNISRSFLLTMFADVTPAGSIATPHNVWTEERGAPIYVCRHQRLSWRAAWLSVRNYG